MTAARGRRSPTLDSFIAGCAVISPCPQAFTLNVRMTPSWHPSEAPRDSGPGHYIDSAAAPALTGTSGGDPRVGRPGIAAGPLKASSVT